MECKISKASSFLQRVLYCGGVPVGGGEVTMEAQNGASSEESARILEDKAPDLTEPCAKWEVPTWQCYFTDYHKKSEGVGNEEGR